MSALATKHGANRNKLHQAFAGLADGEIKVGVVVMVPGGKAVDEYQISTGQAGNVLQELATLSFWESGMSGSHV